MKPFRLGLTGSIGMGKSTTAQFFKGEGCDVWDADAAVHRLYAGAAVQPMKALFPEAIVEGAVDRAALREIIAEDEGALKKIEAVIHPLVAADRETFLENTTSDIVVFDIPLLFETNGQTRMDAVACVDVAPDVQEARVMARGSMTPEQFYQIRARQMPNSEKCDLADYVIVTDTLEHAREQVQDIVKEIRGNQHA